LLKGVWLKDGVYPAKDMTPREVLREENCAVIIDDENREPYEFKYRILGNLDVTYNKDNKAEIKIGILNFSKPDGFDDVKGVICDFIKQDIFPSY